MFESDPKQLKQERKRRIKEGTSLNNKKAPKEARLDSRVAFKEAKKNYRLANKDYKLHKGRHCTHKVRHKKTLLLKSGKLETGVFCYG